MSDGKSKRTVQYVMEGAPGPVVCVNGVEYLYFGGTSYMGLAGNADVIEAGCVAMKKYGVHSATSRGKYGTNPPLIEAEAQAKEYFGTEDAFYFGSGYSSNHIMVSAIRSEVDVVLVNETSHYCVVEAAQISQKPVYVFNDEDMTELKGLIDEHDRVLMMSDAVGPSSGRIAPVMRYIEMLQNKTYAGLLLDDAHGFGVLGESGRGVYDMLGLWEHVNGGCGYQDVELFVCGTLAKALGGFGGIIPGTSAFLSKVRGASHYYDGASAPASAVAGATAKALSILYEDASYRERLRRNIKQVREGLRALELNVPEGMTANFGVSIGSAQDMLDIHEQLKSKGILLPYVGQYSGIPAEGVLRFAVFANHTNEQIQRLLNEMKAIL